MAQKKISITDRIIRIENKNLTMNQKTLYTISIIVLTLLISGCGKRSGDNYLIGKLESFENTDMVMPDQLDVVQDGSAI